MLARRGGAKSFGRVRVTHDELKQSNSTIDFAELIEKKAAGRVQHLPAPEEEVAVRRPGANVPAQLQPPCVDEAEVGDAVVDAHDANDAQDHSLSAMYARMPGDRMQTVLFDLHSSATPTDEHEAELCRELGAAFSRCLGYQDGHDLRASHELRRLIAYNSNYEVEQVVRVMNRPQYKMQQAFAENYAIDARRKVYHGTSEAGARLITAVGFKGAARRRAKFGKGIYTSPVVWEALRYAKPDANMKQVLIAAELLQGPTAHGSQDQIDFGVDSHGSEILTLSNPDETILCTSKGHRLLYLQTYSALQNTN